MIAELVDIVVYTSAIINIDLESGYCPSEDCKPNA